MPNVITLKATDGTTVQYVDEIIGSGGMKDVYSHGSSRESSSRSFATRRTPRRGIGWR